MCSTWLSPEQLSYHSASCCFVCNHCISVHRLGSSIMGPEVRERKCSYGRKCSLEGFLVHATFHVPITTLLHQIHVCKKRINYMDLCNMLWWRPLCPCGSRDHVLVTLTASESAHMVFWWRWWSFESAHNVLVTPVLFDRWYRGWCPCREYNRWREAGEGGTRLYTFIGRAKQSNSRIFAWRHTVIVAWGRENVIDLFHVATCWR